MKILVIGSAAHFEECRQKLSGQQFRHVVCHADAENNVTEDELIFDFLIGEAPLFFQVYAQRRLTVFLNTCTVSLAGLAHSTVTPVKCTAFGFNGLPSLFNREFLEVSLLRNDDLPLLEKICNGLNTAFLRVDDRVGMVTPRVIGMIITEAYHTVQQGTASREDIDRAMKLGTNYPYGPFEWCRRIGVKNVYELLTALYEDTKDERYRIPPLLKKEYLADR